MMRKIRALLFQNVRTIALLATISTLLVACDEKETKTEDVAPKLQIIKPLSCTTTAGTERCTGVVKNISDKNINALYAGAHWLTADGKPASDSEWTLGDVEFSPILPGQEASFRVVTPQKNPALTNYKIFFRKFGDKEDAFPVQQYQAPR